MVTKVLLLIGIGGVVLVAALVSNSPIHGQENDLAEAAGQLLQGAQNTATPTRTPFPTVTNTATIGFGPTLDPRLITVTPTPSITRTPTASPRPGTATPAISPTPSATSIYRELRTLQTDEDFVLRFRLDETCFEVDQEITGTIGVRNLKDVGMYVYLEGQISFSINNSPLLPDFPPREPIMTEDFIYLQPNEEVVLLEIEDVGLYIQGMGPESGIDFLETETVFGLPAGDYWLTAGYSNPHDGLKQQVGRTYLIPEAAWRGVAISRELRFSVVEDLDDCPNNT